MPLSVDDNSRHIAQSVLQPHERLLWSGQPDPFRMMLQAWPVLVIAVIWTSFAVYWTAAVSGFKIPDFSAGNPLIVFSIIGMVASFIGLSMFALPSLAWRRAGRTYYAVTDDQCLIIVVGHRKYVNVYSEEDVDRVRCIERDSGRGDLIFSPSAKDAAKDATRVRQAGFYGIADVRSVEQIVRKTLRKP